MARPTSLYLNARQLKGLSRAGDFLLPGDDDLPSFSRSGCAAALDRVFDTMPEGELADLRTLLTFLGYTPAFVLPALLRYADRRPARRGPLVTALREVKQGLQALLMSLYYGDPRVLRALDYRVSVYTAETLR